MAELEAQRTLVKSPPELWAEVSDAASLARHLGEVGEIRITRLEPETTVAWEGEHASGTVEMAPAGWGTRVTLRADPIAPDVPAEPEVEVEVVETVIAEPVAPPVVEPEPSPDRAGSRFGTFLRRVRRRRVEANPTPEAVAPEEPAPAEAAEPPPEDPLLGALTAALDSLGSAHHRPFSRG